MDDKTFLHALHMHDADADLVSAIRRVLARWRGITPVDVLPDDEPREYHENLTAGWAKGWDETGFLIKLEEELNQKLDMPEIRLPAFVSGRFLFWKRVAPETLGEWIKKAVPEIRKHVVQPEER